MEKANRSLIKHIVLESKSLERLEDIEKLVDNYQDLSKVPMQPLYMATRATSTDQLAQLLHRFSFEQRQTFLDLDLWNKDVVDVDEFERWIEVYSKVTEDELLSEFVKKEDFLLYLKARVNIWTFDVEEPEYPDHDYYFLTDDSLLLVEYSEHYKYPNELKYLVRKIYADFGVENAYSMLFKLVNDSFSILQEDLFQTKKERLRDIGVVDYYESMEKLHPFVTMKQLKNFINSQSGATASIYSQSLNQLPHFSAVIAYQGDDEDIVTKALHLVKDEKRIQFLTFNFTLLVNSTVSLEQAFKSDRITLNQIGKYSKNCLSLGIDFTQSLGIDNVFDKLNFIDVYRVGHSLIQIELNKIKKSLRKHGFENDSDFFLGTWFNSILDLAFQKVPKVKSFGAGQQAQEIATLAVYSFWKEQLESFLGILPFCKQFFDTYGQVKKTLNDSLYLNYAVDEIDLESIFLSYLINFHNDQISKRKIACSINDLKAFLSVFCNKVGEEYLIKPKNDFNELLTSFAQSFGLDIIEGFVDYLYIIVFENLNGYELDKLKDEDFRHVGGPILLAT